MKLSGPFKSVLSVEVQLFFLYLIMNDSRTWANTNYSKLKAWLKFRKKVAIQTKM